MNPQAPPRATDPDTLKLQRAIYYQVVHDLHAMLPRPPDEPPEHYERRYRSAIAHVAALRPTNADEANIAAHYVAAGARATEYERLAEQNATYPDAMFRLERQAVSLMRESRGYRSLLLRVQAARHKREANEKTYEQDMWSEYCAHELMTEALDDVLTRPLAAGPTPAAAPAPGPPAIASPRRRSRQEDAGPRIAPPAPRPYYPARRDIG
jgi:hypothetical protein